MRGPRGRGACSELSFSASFHHPLSEPLTAHLEAPPGYGGCAYPRLPVPCLWCLSWHWGEPLNGPAALPHTEGSAVSRVCPTTRGFKVRFSPCRLLCSVGLWVLLYGSMGLCPSPLHNIFRPFLSTRICLLPQQLPCLTHLRLGGERLQGHPGWEGCRASAMARFDDAFDGSNLGPVTEPCFSQS